MSFNKSTTMGLGLMVAMSVSACDFGMIEELPGQTSVSVSAPTVTAPVQRASAPAATQSRPRVQTVQPSRQVAAAPPPTPAPAVVIPAASSPATSGKPTAESCAIKKVAGCAFILNAGGSGDGGGAAGGGGGGGWGG